jgi:hypothetical protein
MTYSPAELLSFAAGHCLSARREVKKTPPSAKPTAGLVVGKRPPSLLQGGAS